MSAVMPIANGSRMAIGMVTSNWLAPQSTEVFELGLRVETVDQLG